MKKIKKKKFRKIVYKVKDMKIEKSESMKGVIKIVFEKEVDEKKLYEEYEKM